MGNTESSSRHTQQVRGEGTVKPAVPFDKDADATALNQAMLGLGTDEDAINAILTKRSNAQRQEIKESYKQKYKLDLVESLKDELSGDYRKTVKALMEEPAVFYARCIYNICTCRGDKLEIDLLELIYPLGPMDVLGVTAAYEQTFKKNLVEDVSKADNGPFKNIILNVLVGERSSAILPDMKQAATDAAYFYKTKPADWQLPNEHVEELFGKASIVQLRQTFQQADAQFLANNQSLEKVVQESTMDDIQKAAFAVIFKSIYQPLVFYVDGLYCSMKGFGTNDDKLIRIIVGRSEIDLASIRDLFKEKYTTTLAAMVEDDTSGDYKNVLIGIINADCPPASATTQSTTS